MKSLRVMLLVVGIAFCGSATADEAGKKAAAELLDAMKMDDSFAQLIDTTLKGQLSGKPELAKHESVFRAFFAKHMSYASLKPRLVAAYAEEFTAAELSQTAKFYRTPTGQKFVAKLPHLYARGAQIGQEAVQAHIPELIQMIQDAEKGKTDAKASPQG